MSRLSRPFERAIEALHLPPMPRNLIRFHEETQSDRPSFDTLTLLALGDPALCARLLGAANAPSLRGNGALMGMRECLEALGVRMLRVIAGCMTVQAALTPPGEGAPVELSGFWRHSLAVAELARTLATELGANAVDREEAYLAGLLHDIGQLLLLGAFGTRYRTLLSEVRDERELAAVELQQLSTDHCAAAAWLVDQWALPSSMADAICFHHLDADATAGLDRLGRILWSAHVLVQRGSDSAHDIATAANLLRIDAARLRWLAGEVEALADTRVADAMAGPADLPRPAPPDPTHNGGGLLLRSALSIPAALQSLAQDLSTLGTEAELLHGLGEAARLLFGIQRSVFLLKTPAGPFLAAVPAATSPAALRRLDIPLQGTACLCADAARENRLIATHDHKPPERLPAIDRQIANALDTEGAVYVPMFAQGELLGVVALGASPVQLKLLEQQKERLHDFARVAGRLVGDWRQLRERERRAEADAAARFALQAQRIAHEVGNPLAVIRNYLNLLAGDTLLASPERAQADLGVVREEIDRLAEILRGFSAAPLPTSSAGRADLKVALEALRQLYGATLFDHAGMRLELILPREPVWVCGELDSIKQIVFNLWKNAAQALGGSGSVVTELEPHVDHNGARHAQLRIRDTGPGLPAPVRESLYQPLARESGADRSTERAGLGLSIVLALVKGLGGAITCVSRPGEGTTFTILIPES